MMKRGGLLLVSFVCLGGLACVERPLDGAETGQSTSTGGETSGVPTSGASGASSNIGPGTGTGAPEPGTDTSTSGPGTSTSTSGPGAGSSMTEPGTSTTPGADTTDASDGCGVLCDDTEDTGPAIACDLFAQDCPEGQKCAAHVEGGNWWNAAKCVPVTGDRQPGDECTAIGGGGSGLDDCAKGAMCWNVDDMNQGTCIALCTGTLDDPMCPDQQVCAQGGLPNLCLPNCDPLAQDCPGDDLCVLSGDGFQCVLDASGEEGQVFDPCEFANGCDKGQFCAVPKAASECDPAAIGCCLPFCDLLDANSVCPGEGQSCVALWEEGMAPPGFENVGLCALPI